MGRPVGAKRAVCSYQSGLYKGFCDYDNTCAIECMHESPYNLGGACDGFPGKCFCQVQCPPA